MPRILIIGEGESAEALACELREAGYEATACAPKDADTHLSSRPPPVALLFDLTGGPDQAPPLDLLSESGAQPRTPTLAVLPEGRLLAGDADLGVDDFVLYPLRPGELAARLHRLAGQPESDSSDLLRRGALAIDLASYRVSIDGALVELTFKEYELLRFLAADPGRVFTREALLDKVWGYDFYGGARTVDVHIRRLRSKIESGGRTFIETVRSVGYRFHASP